MTSPLRRAQGCLLGQLAGDSLGSLVEFKGPIGIAKLYPDGVRDLANGGTWNILAGQPTDDSEMALTLARTLITDKTYKADHVFAAYQDWYASAPFDCGNTIRSALTTGSPNPESQANGALMRVSPLGIFGSRFPLDTVAVWATEDARLTHPHPICLQANTLFAQAIAHAIATGPAPQALYDTVCAWTDKMDILPDLRAALHQAAIQPPTDYTALAGWVLVAFGNAFWQLLHAPSLEEALVDTVGRGGDTDTNAAICGALMGAVYGKDAIPARWTDTILSCRPSPNNPLAAHPRPACYWPTDALELAALLIEDGLG